MIYQNISLEDIRPFIRYAHFIQPDPTSHFDCQQAYDCRLFYTVSGSSFIRIEENIHTMERGSLLLMQSKVKYHILTDHCDGLILLGINFDYTQNFRHLNTPIPPVSPENFKQTQILEQLHFTDCDPLNKFLYLKDMQSLEECLLSLLNEYNTKKLFYSEKITGQFLSVLSEIARFSLLQSININKSTSRIDEIIHYIHMHYPEYLTNQKMSELFYYHPNYINKLMVLHTGLSLHQYLLNYRIERAIHLLQTTEIPAIDIALLVGFKDYNHFLKYFKQKTGRTTNQYRL